MGSRFMVTHESGAHADSKQAVIDHNVMNTLRSLNYDGVPVRAISTPFARKLARRKPLLPKMLWRAWQMSRISNTPVRPLLKEFPGNLRLLHFLAWLGHGMFYMLRGIEQGDLENGVQTIGQSQGIIGEILPAGEVVVKIKGGSPGRERDAYRRLELWKRQLSRLVLATLKHDEDWLAPMARH
jgi:enoyl-[acyl-carrier protein] reductase II